MDSEENEQDEESPDEGSDESQNESIAEEEEEWAFHSKSSKPFGQNPGVESCKNTNRWITLL